MKDDNIDISNNKSELVDIYINSDINFDYIVTVCDESNAQKCPVFPGKGKRIHIGFEDPRSLNGSYEQKLKKTIEIRNKIKEDINTLFL
jgi:arsenate reductase